MSTDANKSLHVVTKRLVEHLRRTNQLDIFPEVVKESLRLTRDELPENTALVKSAYKLSNAEIKELKEILASLVDRNIVIKNVIDKSVVAGLFIRLGDLIIDQSLANKIEALGKNLDQ